MSTDSIAANAKFAEAQGFPFPLLCDTDRNVSLSYGAVGSRGDRTAKRMTYVIGRDGTIAQAIAKVDTKTHAESLLADL